jgi:hypothetical protein
MQMVIKQSGCGPQDLLQCSVVVVTEAGEAMRGHADGHSTHLLLIGCQIIMEEAWDTETSAGRTFWGLATLLRAALTLGVARAARAGLATMPADTTDLAAIAEAMVWMCGENELPKVAAQCAPQCIYLIRLDKVERGRRCPHAGLA